MEWAVWAVMTAALCVASVTDIKTHTILIPTFPTAFAICLAIRGFTGTLSADHWAGMGIMFVIAFMLCLFSAFGGGDLLMLTATGFATGASKTIMFCVFSAGISMIVLIFLLGKKCGNKRIAIAPIALASYCLTIATTILHG